MVVVREMHGDVKELIYIVAWVIWFACNSAIHDTSPWSVVGIIDKVDSLLSELVIANFADRIISVPVSINGKLFP